MALAARYYITAESGIYIDLSYSRPGSIKPDQEFDIRGGAGSDWLYAPAGSTADFTQVGTGNDILYVTGNFADYVQTVDDIGTYTLSRSLPGGAVETIRFKADFDDDVVYFADGHVVLNLESSGLLDENAGTFRTIEATDLQSGGTPAHPLESVPPQQSYATRVYVFDPNGVNIPALAAPGQAVVIYGGAGDDTVEVRPGTSVDFSQTGTGNDKLFLTGRLSDYSQSIVDNVYTFTRISGLPAGTFEVIRLTSSYDDDYIYFGDGYINLNAEASQPSGVPLMDPESGEFRQMQTADFIEVKAIKALSADTGASATDFITSVAEQTVSGTLSGLLMAGETVQVSADGGVSWVNANVTGTNWSAAGVMLIAGTHQLTTRLLGTNGESISGPSKEYTFDTSIPDAVIDAAMSLSQDTGASATDFITSIAAQTISGTFAGVIGSGEKIQVSADGGASWIDAAWSGNSWSAALTLQPGSGELIARIVNADGDSIYSVQQAYALDTTATLPTLQLQAASDLGSSSGDGVTNDATPTFDVTGESGATIVLFNDSNGNGIVDAGETLGSVTLTGTTGTITSSALSDGAYGNIKIIQTDVAGNVSAASAPAAALVIDTSIPTAPTLHLQTASDTGASNSDGITSDNTPTFDVTGENGATVTLFNDSNGNGIIDAGEILGSVTLSGTAGTITSNTLNDGVYSNIKAQQTDVAGNISIASVATPAITVKTAAPSMPTLHLQAASDVGISNSDGITSDNTPTFDVTGESGATVTLFNDSNNNGVIDAGELLGSVTLSGTSGSVTSTPLSSGTYTKFKVQQTDAAGNTSIASAAATTLTIDTTAPAAPTLQLQAASDTGASNSDGITSDNTPTFNVTGESGATVTLFNDSNSNGVVDAGESLGSVTLSGTSGSVTSIPLGDGAYTRLKVQQVDAAGNASVASTAATGMTIDATAPSAATLQLQAASDTGVSSSDGITDVNTPTFDVTGENGATVTLFNDSNNNGVVDAGESLGSTVISGSTSTITSAPLQLGSYSNLKVIQSDLAGNLSVASVAHQTITISQFSFNLSAISAGTGGFMLRGQCTGDFSGWSVSSAGDVNGDGLADMVMGAYSNDPAGLENAGRTYVIFGRTDGTTVNRASIEAGTGGFVIDGQCANDFSGYSVSAAGDVNGDGLSDIIVGAYQSAAPFINDGRSYVIFGKADTAAVKLSALAGGTGGFVIDHERMTTGFGYSVASAGDVNGDGMPDLLVGAPLSPSPGAPSSGGRAYVIYGQPSGSMGGVPLIEVAPAPYISNTGFVIIGLSGDDQIGRTVSSAGDVNGDGLMDVIVGSNLSDPAAGVDAGRSYVVFGKTNQASTVYASNIVAGTGGFVINGQSAGDASGVSVSSAGDVNGDGLADIIVGAYLSDPVGGTDAGRSYVIFGKTNTAGVDLSAIASGSGGFVINGQSAGDRSGISVSAAGDVNGDGLADIIVGAYQSDPSARTDAGRSYVIFGKTDTTAVNLSAIANGIGGFGINGQSAGDYSGSSVSSAGDVDGDGLADLMIGAYRTGGNFIGNTYVLLSSQSFSSMASVTQWGTASGETLTGTAGNDRIAAGAGNDTIIAGGGTDVIYGGPGDDVIILSATDIESLGNSRIDGGAGIDTLKLNGSNIILDLITLNNLAIKGIEKIDLTGSGNNTLKLSRTDLFNLMDSTSHRLVIDGNDGDKVQRAGIGDFILTGIDSTAYPGHTYHVYTNSTADSFQQLWVDAAVDGGTPAALPAVSLSAIAAGTGGFVINGQCTTDLSGYAVSSAGDVNGDGLADLIVGAYQSDPASRTNGGRSYVVFGKTSNTTSIELSAVAAGTGGFVINGQCASDGSGISVSSAGDMNGDGMADIIIGAYQSDPAGGTDAGRSYVVFGKSANTTAVNLSAIAAGTGGFVINGEAANDLSGYSVSSAGDVNGDGLMDVIVGAYQGDNGGIQNAGNSYIVFGKTSMTAIHLSEIAAGTGGYIIRGDQAYDNSGYSVSSAGDVNGDGLADLIIGAPHAYSDAGRSYVVFGKTGSEQINLAVVEAGTGGFLIRGEQYGDISGYAVSSAGDVNGDGLADVIIGVHQSDPAAGANAGRTYVVYGKSGNTTYVDLSNIAAGIDGFVINGESSGDNSGYTVSAAGDLNGDGLADLIIGARAADPAITDAGRSYVVFGKLNRTEIDLSAIAAGTGGFAINGQCAGDLSGYAVSSAGDVDGDGLADLIIGAPYGDPTARADGGRSYVVLSNQGNWASSAIIPWGTSGSITHKGTSGADTLTGTSGNDRIAAGAGDDTITGNGGTDVIYAGAGNDTIELNADNVANLANSRIDGGSGIDTLKLNGSGITLDLSTLTDVALKGIEKIDLTGSGNNTLKLKFTDIFNLVDTTAHKLFIDGNAGDTVQRVGTWTAAGTDTTSFAGHTYNIYTFNTGSAIEKLLIENTITVV